MNLTGTDNVIPTGFSVYQTSSFAKAGAMIYRSSNGSGTVNIQNVQLGVVSALPYDIDVKAFAIEMVYVPQSPARIFLGDGDGTQESLNALHYADNTATTSSVVPMLCDANPFDDAELETDGIYLYSNDTIQLSNPLGSLDPFPTMKQFWCMKYEISQAGYRDFLNTLDSLQQTNRVSFAITGSIGTNAFSTLAANSRNFIELAKPAVADTPAVFGLDGNGNNIFDEASDGEWLSCNYLAWVDVAAYLDWAGLAPMSEIQFEFAGRGASSAGANPAIFGGYVWGTNSIATNNYLLSDSNKANEAITNLSSTSGNANYGTTTSVKMLRNGIFASGTSNRVTSGATYYGIMGMSGGVYEYTIHLGSVAGRSCRYVPNGNGVLSNLGNAKLSVGGAGFWPGMEGNSSLSISNSCSGTCEVTGSAGIRLRGGSCSSSNSELMLSNRGTVFLPTARSSDRGGRGVLNFR